MSILFQVPARNYEAIPGLAADDRKRPGRHASAVREFKFAYRCLL